MTGIVDTRLWAEETFGACDLGDIRRTKRLVRVAQRIAQNPAGSLPKQMANWAELKGAYRFFDSERVTFDAIGDPHWQQTRGNAVGKTLVICDTSELNFGSDREGLGHTGNGAGRGFLLHSALMVDAETRSISGVAGQTLHYRPQKKRRKQNSTQQLKRDRESQVWGRLVDGIGGPPEGASYAYVCDRGADNFEVFFHLQSRGCDWVVRAKRQGRNLITADGESVSLPDLLPRLPLLGSYELSLRSRPRQKARVAQIEVHSTRVSMPVPHHKSPWLKSQTPEPIPMWLVHVREVNVPQHTEGIEWLLWTSMPADTLDEAWTVIEDYESRWLIEEFHKALKSGCRVKARQLQTADRLEAMVSLLSIVAAHLLRLKTMALATPQRSARSVVPPLWLHLLKAAREGRIRNWKKLTLREFYREIAKLGGFLGRKCDGEPGWLTIWRGWEQLALLVRGAELAAQLQDQKKCG